MSTLTAPPPPRWHSWLSYALITILTLTVGLAGGLFKFVNNEMWISRFNDFGYPLWFMYLTGLIEIAAVVALWFPRIRVWGAVLLIATMVGATATNIMAGVPFIQDLVFIALALVVLWLHRRAMRAGTAEA